MFVRSRFFVNKDCKHLRKKVQFTAKFCLGFGNDDFWTAGKYYEFNNKFQWSTSDKFKFTNWADDEPNEDSGKWSTTDSCILLAAVSDFNWCSRNCIDRNYMVCKRKS